MLKTMLAASGAITASAFLPGKWLKPVVQSGALPVHASASVLHFNVAPGHEGNYYYSQTNKGMINNLFVTVTQGGSGTPGISGVQVTLTSFQDRSSDNPSIYGAVSNFDLTPPNSQTTDLNGAVGFGTLSGGSYYINFDVAGGGGIQGYKLQVNFTVSGQSYNYVIKYP